MKDKKGLDEQLRQSVQRKRAVLWAKPLRGERDRVGLATAAGRVQWTVPLP